MKKLSPRALTALCNLALAFIVLVIGAVCFLPSSAAVSAPAGKVYDRGTKSAVSLTINVYWGTDIVEKMLDLFRERGVRVTFFVGGCWADDNVPTVRRMAEEGHEVGSHGYFHREHDKLSLRENVEEIGTSVEFLSLVTGKQISLFAPPSGAYDDTTVRAAKDCGCKVVLWSKDTIDWRDKDEALCYTRATEGLSAGELILMHPMPHTVQALPRILGYLRAHALKAVPVSENLA